MLAPVLYNSPLNFHRSLVPRVQVLRRMFSRPEAMSGLTDAELHELEELVKQERIDKARESFYDFCTYMDHEFFSGRRLYLKEIASILQQLETGAIRRVLISLPPRAGKSYIVSLFCAWYIGRNPERSIMRNSYGASLAKKFSYDVRDFIQRDEYLEIFPEVLLRADKAEIWDWAITEAKQTSYFCAGVSGAITGKGCDGVAILDDPIKNIDEALSEVILEKAWQWYTSTHKSRMEKGCPEIQIATRWSKKDVIGRIKSEEPSCSFETYLSDPACYHNHWVEVTVPALDMYGETFCDDVKTTEEYLELKHITDSFIWEAEFMQNPIESKGLLFPETSLMYFNLKDLKTHNGKVISSATVAAVDTADEGEDFLSAGIGEVIQDDIYITDVVFTQEQMEITEPLVAALIIKHQAHKVNIESNNGGKGFARRVTDLCKGFVNAFISWRPNTSNKETRILLKSGLVRTRIHFRHKTDYPAGSDYDLFMRSLTSYVKLGRNKHDDAADMVTMLAEMVLEKKTLKAVARP